MPETTPEAAELSQNPQTGSRLKFVVPNLITATSLTMGVTSLFMSLSGKFYWAGWMVLISVLLDKLDGTSARLLKASSRFGVEFDSLADLVAFGVAPAGLVFSALSQNPLYTDHTVNTVVLGLSCGIYVLCAALRLGRFNVEATLGGNDVYFGLPMPMAGGFLVSGLLVLMKYAPKRFVYHRWAGDYPVLGSFSSPDVLFFFFWVHVLLVAYLMVSSLKVPKPKKTGTITGDVYLIGNMVITYIVIPFRVFPEYLWFVALQYLLISIYYTFFTKRSKRHHKRAFLDVLAMPPLDEKD